MPEAISLYIKDVEKIPLLTPEEEVKLAKQVQKGSKVARKKIIQANLRLVINIAKKYSYLGVPMMDLIEEGNLGLMHAVNKFDPDRGYRFSTYAGWWIKQYVTRAIATQGKTIRIPVYMTERIAQLKKVTEELTHKLKRKPTMSEIAKKMKISLKQLKTMKRISTDTFSLDTPIGDMGTSQIVDMIEDTTTPSPLSGIGGFLQHERMETLLKKELNEREQKILAARYGLEDGAFRTLSEVSKMFGISRERIRQIEANALKKLKEAFQRQDDTFEE